MSIQKAEQKDRNMIRHAGKMFSYQVQVISKQSLQL